MAASVAGDKELNDTVVRFVQSNACVYTALCSGQLDPVVPVKVKHVLARFFFFSLPLPSSLSMFSCKVRFYFNLRRNFFFFFNLTNCRHNLGQYRRSHGKIAQVDFFFFFFFFFVEQKNKQTKIKTVLKECLCSTA